MDNYKEQLKRMLYNYAVPNPYMYRQGWEPVYNYGVNRASVENSLMNNLPRFNNPYVRQFLQNRYLMNELQNDPNYLR